MWRELVTHLPTDIPCHPGLAAAALISGLAAAALISHLTTPSHTFPHFQHLKWRKLVAHMPTNIFCHPELIA